MVGIGRYNRNTNIYTCNQITRPAILTPSTLSFGSFAQAQDNFEGIEQQLQDSEREFHG